MELQWDNMLFIISLVFSPLRMAIFPGILVIHTPDLLMWQKIALSLPFGDDGSWSGKVTIGMGVVAFTSATPSGLTAAAYYAVYDNLVLCK